MCLNVDVELQLRYLDILHHAVVCLSVGKMS